MKIQLTMIAAVLWAATSATAGPLRQHFEVWVDGARRGSAWIDASADGTRHASALELQVVHVRTPVWLRERLQIRRDPHGQWLRIDARSTAGRVTQRVRVIRRGDVLHWQAGGVRRALRWSAALLLEDQWLAALARVPYDTLSPTILQTFDPWQAGALTWQVQRRPDTATLTVQSIDGSLPQTLRFDAAGQLQQRVLWRGGLRLEWRACVAPCTAVPVQPLALLDRQAVRAPYTIPDAARAGPIRYRLQLPADWPAPLPSSVEQQVVVDADGTLRVTVCPRCRGTDDTPTVADLQRWRAPDPWIQSADARIRRLARQAGGPRTPALSRMRRLQTLIGEHLQTIDPQGYHSALDALGSRRGDCTESALLLAATARASGLPARIVAGLVYSQRYSGRRDVYTPHYWVQVWIDTRWHSFDAGVGAFDATHLALVTGGGDPQSTQGVLSRSGEVQILRMGRVRTIERADAAQAPQTHARGSE